MRLKTVFKIPHFTHCLQCTYSDIYRLRRSKKRNKENNVIRFCNYSLCGYVISAAVHEK